MGVVIVCAPTRFEMSDAGRWVRARVIAVMLGAVFVVGFTVLPLAAVFFLVRFGGSRPGAYLLLGDRQAFLVAAAGSRRFPVVPLAYVRGPGGPFHCP
jgi:hypothetical protein